jgi:hypothetical protein
MFTFALKPINNVRIFYSELNKYISESTEPPVDGIKHKIIFENDDKNIEKGFVVSFFPKSDEVHKASGPGKTKDRFFKRYGDSFVSLSTADIKALFFRNLSPDLELGIVYQKHGSDDSLVFSLINKGKGIAQNCAVYFYKGISSWTMIPSYYFVSPNVIDMRNRINVSHIFRHQNSTHIKLTSGITLCPEEAMDIATAYSNKDKLSIDSLEIKYKIFAENMIPKEGTKIYDSGQFLEKSSVFGQ